MNATTIVRDAIGHTPQHHIRQLYEALAEHSPTRGDSFLRNLTPELVERTLLNATWESYECGGLAWYERVYLARGILGVADGRRTAHVTVLVAQGADGKDFVVWFWAGDPAGEAESRAA